MCLLGCRWWIITFGVQSPPKPPFLGLNRHFKPNMRKMQTAISSDLCIRLTWNLTGSCGQQQRLRGWSRAVVKQFQDGGRPPFWKSIYRHISVKNNHPILMKFCTQQQILNWMNVTWSKMKKLHWTDSEFDRTYLLFQTVLPPACGTVYRRTCDETWTLRVSSVNWKHFYSGVSQPRCIVTLCLILRLRNTLTVLTYLLTYLLTW